MLRESGLIVDGEPDSVTQTRLHELQTAAFALMRDGLTEADTFSRRDLEAPV